jgi:ribosomal protein S18 acetylase RimI-like enzyme
VTTEVLPATSVNLRAADPGDEAFVGALFAERRAAEFAPLGWPPADLEAFLRSQSAAQERGYRDQHPGAAFQIVLADSVRIGRLVVDHSATAVWIVDVALTSSWRGRGVGTALVREVQRTAGEAGLPVCLHVESTNGGARRLYERLGFEATATTGMHVRMEWRPDVECRGIALP